MRDAPYPELLERIEELEAKLKIATEALKSAVECDEEFWGKHGRRETELAIQKIEAIK